MHGMARAYDVVADFDNIEKEAQDSKDGCPLFAWFDICGDNKNERKSDTIVIYICMIVSQLLKLLASYDIHFFACQLD